MQRLWARVGLFRPLNDFYYENWRTYGFRLMDEGETLNAANYQCPHCMCADRDRLSMLFFAEHIGSLPTDREYHLLDLAPLDPIRSWFGQYTHIRYRSADVSSPTADDRVDVNDMSIYGDGHFDLIYCSHVLEHVPDPVRAARELHRVLSAQGVGVVMVPIFPSLEENYENPSVGTPEGRWKHFGQNDHLRLFSKKGFIDCLESGGFRVQQLDIRHFGREAFDRHALAATSVLYVVRK